MHEINTVITSNSQSEFESQVQRNSDDRNAIIPITKEVNLNIDDFKKVVERARAQKDIYENDDFWQAVFTVVGTVERKYLFTAAVHEKDAALSDFYTRFLSLREKELDATNDDILYTYPADRLLYTIVNIARKAALSAYAKISRTRRRELSLYAELDGDCKLTVGDTIPDTAPSPDTIGFARAVLREHMTPDATDKLVSLLGIKRTEFCGKAEKTITAERFIATLDLYLSEAFDRKELAPYYAELTARGAVNMDKLYNRIYNENRKSADRPHDK